MSKPAKNLLPSQSEYWKVSQSAGILTNYACSISAQHIQDGLLRLQFNREVAYYMREIVRDVERGKKSPAHGLRDIQEEQRSLLEQSRRIALQGLGVVAGGFQIAGGAATCIGTVGWACPVGVLTVMHGANNIYENGRNLREGKSDTKGPLRKLYQSATGSELSGNIAYGTVDMGLSIFGIIRPVLKPDAWRLFKYLKSHKEAAFRQTSSTALGVDAAADAATSFSMYEELNRGKNE